MHEWPRIIALDTEFITEPPGNQPIPVCLCWKELRSGAEGRVWFDEPRVPSVPPFPIDNGTLFVAYYSSAEWGVFKALGWPMPRRVLDLFVEFRNLTNGRPPAGGYGLLSAMQDFNLPAIDVVEKRTLVDRINAGPPFSNEDRSAILEYFMSDVAALAALLPCMWPHITSMGQALLRGRYMVAAAGMEWAGTPIDVPTLQRLRAHWGDIQGKLISAIDADYGVYEGRSFRSAWFERWLIRTGTPWPRHPSGALDLSDSTFRSQARAYPAVSPLRELRSSLAELRLNKLSVGADGRNRTLLSAFRARSSRNEPSNSRSVFGASVWLWGLIRPPPGHAVAYVDWSQQEFGIAAALSGDAAMIAAYESGDPYLSFAKQAGAVPDDATEETHGAERGLFKQCVLGTQYGLEAAGLALRIGKSPLVAANLLADHWRTFRRFWAWSDATVDHAQLTGGATTCFGWRLHVGADFNPRAVRNHPMQSHGSEMMRLAACLATERGVEVCAPIHDAFLVYAPMERLAGDIATTQTAMAEASRIVLAGFELRSKASVTPYPRRYADPRGTVMWRTVMGLIDRIDAREEATA